MRSLVFLALLTLGASLRAPPADDPTPASVRESFDRARAAQADKDPAGARERILEAIEGAIALADRDEDPKVPGLLADLARFAQEVGDLHGAVTAGRKLVEVVARTLPDDHPDLQKARQNLAGTLYYVGDLEEARALQEKVLEIHSRTLPDDHPDVQKGRMNLALMIEGLGDLPGSRALAEKVLEVFTRTLPDDHPHLQMVRGNLSATLATLGDLQSARALQEKVLEVSTRTLPNDHPELQKARGNLAITIGVLGDLQGARALQELVLEVGTRTLPDDHPHLQARRGNLAATLYNLGDLQGARTLHTKVLEVFTCTLPADHPDIQKARVNLGVTLESLGDLPGARTLQEKALQVSARTLPDDHPDLQGARQSLAITIASLGDLPGARALEEKVLEVRARTLPDDHPLLQASRGNLARTSRSLGDLQGARALEQKVLEVRTKTLADDHSDLQAARGNLALTLRALGDLPGARALEEKVLEVFSRTLPEDHPDLQTARANLASTIGSLGDLQAARTLQEKALAVRTLTLPSDHADLLATRRILAETLAGLDDGAALEGCLSSLAAGLDACLGSAANLSPREARERLGSIEQEISTLLSFGSPGMERKLFGLVENLRASASFPFDPSAAEDDLELSKVLEEARSLRARIQDSVASLGDAEHPRTTRSELSEMVRARDQAERKLRSALKEKGLVPPEIDAAVLARALPPDARAIGYRRYTRSTVDPGARQGNRREEHLLAFVLAPGGSLTRVELGPIAAVQSAAKSWRDAIGKPLERGVSPPPDTAERDRGEALRKIVFDPLLPLLQDARLLHVCFDDALHLVPLEALPLPGEEADLLGTRYRIVCETAFARLLAPEFAHGRTHEAGEPRLVALGAVSFNTEIEGDQTISSAAIAPVLSPAQAETPARSDRAGPLGTNWDPLPQTRAEVEGVAALFEEVFGRKADLLLGREATKRKLHELSRGAHYLHVATHGYFADESVRSIADRPPASPGPSSGAARASASTDAAARNPPQPGLYKSSGLGETVARLAPMTLAGLALAGANRGADSLGRVGGILTAEELCSFDLYQCELAVLSACETNVGISRAGQGIQSLQAALHAAGTRSSITSLWKVDDEATRELFADFYTRIWVKKEKKAEALWQAKMALRAKGRSTRDWAAWVLTGAPE